MAGGNFDPLVEKERPGDYMNITSSVKKPVGTSRIGVVVIPLIGHKYGPEGEFITLYNDDPDVAYEKLGYSVNDDNDQMLLIREAFKRAYSVKVWIVAGGTQATATTGVLTVKAKYGGTRGNAIKYVIADNPVSGKDVTVYLETTIVDKFEGVTTVADLIAQSAKFTVFSGTGSLTNTAGTTLSGGADGTVTSEKMTAFLDALESVSFHALAFPVLGEDAESFKTACKTKIKYLNETVGKRVKAFVSDFSADYEGIYNVTNAVKLSDGTVLTKPQATAYAAALYASASMLKSNTYEPYDGAVEVSGRKGHEEAVAAIKNGEFFFSVDEDGTVVVEYDINSMTTFGDGVDKSYRKGRVQRVFDTFSRDLTATFPPGKLDNDKDGWDIMEGIGKQKLKEYQDAGAITNVDLENDFYVNRSLSGGDSTYFRVGLQPVDSAEKLYFDIVTR